jgi:hypothetical protein
LRAEADTPTFFITPALDITLARRGLRPLSRDDGAATFWLETKNVLYSIRTTVYRSTRGWQLVTLKLSMKRRRPKSLLVVVAAARAPSEGAIS